MQCRLSVGKRHLTNQNATAVKDGWAVAILVHGIRVKLVSNWEENILYTIN